MIGLILIIISAEFKFLTNKINKKYLFDNRKYYYSISFLLNFIGFNLLFDNYGFVIAILVLLAMITFDEFVK